MNENLHIETELIHGGYAPAKGNGATAAPIFQSTSFAYETAEAMEAVFAGRAPGFVYSRINNPALVSLKNRGHCRKIQQRQRGPHHILTKSDTAFCQKR